MEHRVANRLMALRLDDELAALDGRELDDHLARCAACASDWSRLVALESALRGRRLTDPPAGFVMATLRRIRTAMEPPRSTREVFRSALLESAAVLAGTALTITAALSLFGAGRPGGLLVDDIAVMATGFRILIEALSTGSGQPITWPIHAGLAIAVAVAWFGALVMPRTGPPAGRSGGETAP